MSWHESELAAVADVFNGKTPSRSEQRETGHPVLKIRDVDEIGGFRGTFSGFVDSTLAESNSKKQIHKGDTLILNAAHSATHVASKTFLAGDEVAGAMATGEWLIIRSKSDRVSSHFINHWINSEEVRRTLRRIVNGIHLYPKDVAKLKIPLPPLDEQKRIAAVLDKANALRRQRQESLKLTEKLLQSVFLDMFGDPVLNPKDWPLQPLATLGTLDRGVSKHRPRNAPELLGGKYPLIQTGEVSNAGLYIRSFTSTYSEIGFNQSKMWPKGTLCITIAANIAQTGILDFDACFPDSVVGFTPHELQSNSVYVHFLFGFLQAILERNAPQAAQKNINLAILRTLEVPKPPFDLQQQFANFVAKAMSVLDDQTSSLSVIYSAFCSLQQRAFRGELDLSRLVLDPADDMPPVTEPAKPANKTSKPKAAARFLQAPPAIEATLKVLDRTVSKGEPIPWSADYFKYRILATQPAPFSFADLMQKAENVFEEPPPYETIKDIIFDLVGQDEKPALLRQRFDLNEVKETDSDGREISSFTGRKEIVFEPVS